MGLLQRSSFAKGWAPDADAVQAPPDALLRMDNLVLDELGVVALRQGAAIVSAVGTDAHSLYTAILAGTRYRFVGSGNEVYVNGGALQAMAGADDVSFGSYRGQVVFARSTSTYKYDGATVRTWGIAMTGGPPAAVGHPADGLTLATGAMGAFPLFTVIEDDGTGTTWAADHLGTANGATVVTPNHSTLRGVIQLTTIPVNATNYTGGTPASDNDLLTVWAYVTEPNNLLTITIMVDCSDPLLSGAPFQNDYYSGTFTADEATLLNTLNPAFTVSATGHTSIVTRPDFLDGVQVGTVSGLRIDANTWTKLAVRRGDLARTGSTAGRDWTTVSAIRIIVQNIGAVDTGPLRFETVRFEVANAIGPHQWAYVYAFNSGEYVGLSAPSAFSAPLQLQQANASVTIPFDGSRDPQVNEIWLYRFVLNDYYRVAVLTGVSTTGALTIQDPTADTDALTIDLVLESDNLPPPAGIIGVAGPYYDRLWALTPSACYLSRPINVDSFASSQVISVAGADETALWITKTFGGLYVGTTKDIYRIDGTGADLPDGSVDVVFTPLSIDHPPISAGLAQHGTQLIYLAADGWRTLNGIASASIVGVTSQLYRGKTRHGVAPVNLSGRVRAAIAKGQFVAITPEGATTTSSPVLYRQVPTVGGWYRHTYAVNWRSIYREPDGTLLAGDSTGTVWQLDTGTTDNGAAISPVLWTKIDDNDQPYQRKDPWDLRVRLEAGGLAGTIAVHLDGSATPAVTFGFTTTVESLVPQTLAALPACTQLQLRMTGAFSVFRFFDFGLAYRDHPLLTYYMEPKPKLPSLTRRRFSGLNVILDTVDGGVASVAAVLDNVVLHTFLVSTTGPAGRSLSLPTAVGRDLWPRIEKDTTGFELYEATPRIIEELPQVVQGLLPKTNADYTGQKILSGVRFRACTLGVARVVTIYLDNVALPQTFTVTTGPNEPDDITLDFTAAQTARDIALFFDGDVELYTWSPIISAQQPLGVTAWDSGPLDLSSHELVWIRRLDFKVRAASPLTLAVWLDGALKATRTVPVAPGLDTIVPIDYPRGTKGRQPRLVVTSALPFNPYFIRCIVRETGYGQQKTFTPAPVTLGGGGAG